MRFSIVLIIFALIAPILGVPVPTRRHGRGRGNRASGSNSGSGNVSHPRPQPAHPQPVHPQPVKPKVDAKVGDIVVFESHHNMEGDSGKSSSKRKSHPGIVTHHDSLTHVVHILPIAHEHPEGLPTIPAHELGMSAQPGSLVRLKPTIIHQDNILKNIGSAPAGKNPAEALPERLNEEQMAKLHAALGESIGQMDVQNALADACIKQNMPRLRFIQKDLVMRLNTREKAKKRWFGGTG